MPTSTVVDADHIELTYLTHTFEALHQLKQGLSKFIRFPSGAQPLPTRQNPEVLGYLWPCLFPYGTG